MKDSPVPATKKSQSIDWLFLLDETESSFAWMKVKTIKKEERAAF